MARMMCAAMVGLMLVASAAANCMDGSLASAAMRNGMRFGVAAEAKLFDNSRFRGLVRKEFNTLVSENDMKMHVICQPSSTAGRCNYNWGPADRMIREAKSAGMKIRFHALLWHLSIPGGMDGWNLNQQQWRAFVVDYIKTVVKRYKNDIDSWDVVNEAIIHREIEGDDGMPGGMRNSFWLQKLGMDYIELAFKAAAEAHPTGKFFYNDYAVEWKNGKTDRILNKLISMKRAGYKVTGMGFQGHISFWDGQDKYSSNFRRFRNAGLELQLTELDVFQDCVGSPNYFEKQAEVYAKFVEFAIREKFTMVLVWGLYDKISWVNYHQHLFPCKGDPLLFDVNMQPKPAYYAVKETMCKMSGGGGGGGGSGGSGGGGSGGGGSGGGGSGGGGSGGGGSGGGGSGGGGSGGGGSGGSGGGRGWEVAWPADFTNKNTGSPAANKGWYLYSDRDSISTTMYPKGHNRLVVRAHKEGGGDAATLNVYLDGRLVKSGKVGSKTTWVAVTMRPKTGAHTVKVEFMGDHYRDGTDKNLIVEKVVFKKR